MKKTGQPNWSGSRWLGRQAWCSLSYLAVALAAMPALSGCTLLQKPAQEPAFKEPKDVVLPDFDPDWGVQHWEANPVTKIGGKLNAPDDKDKPSYFEITDALAGDLVKARPVKIVDDKTPPARGPEEIMKLAGVLAPPQGQPGWAEATAVAKSWTLGQFVDIEQDPKFNVDLQNRRLVQVFFQGRKGGPWDGKTLCLNRMLVRSGYAWVDLHTFTSIDVSPWLVDEEYARTHRRGLWGMGIVLAGRQQPPPIKGATGRVPKVVVKAGAAKIARPGGKKAGAKPGAKPTAAKVTPTSSGPARREDITAKPTSTTAR